MLRLHSVIRRTFWSGREEFWLILCLFVCFPNLPRGLFFFGPISVCLSLSRRKFLFNYYYRWADIFRTLKLEGVPKWSRADEKRYVSLSDDEIHTRFAHEIKQRDYVLAGVTVACVFGSVLFTRLSQRNVIPGVPLGIFLFGYPVGKTISNQVS